MARQESTGKIVAEPLNALRASRPRIDWTARIRASQSDVQRYSRFVGIMKRALPMLAIALFAAVVAYSLQPRLQDSKRIAMTFQSVGIVNNDLTMIKPRLTGVDSDGDPFVVTAEEAIQDLHNAKLARLKNVEADMTLKKGEWLNATASRGRLDAATQRLRLADDINVYTDTGYELHTSAADIDMRAGEIVGDRAASGQGPAGTFRADRFRIHSVPAHAAKRGAQHPDKILYLYGHVHMTIYRHGAARS